MRLYRHLGPSGTPEYAAEMRDGTFRRVEGSPLGDFRLTDDPIRPGKLLAPIVTPNILCIGLNYRRHAEETKAPLPEHPVLFMKSTAALQNPADPILIPSHLPSDRVDYECEMAVVIGRPFKNVSRDRALDFVLGYTCANDVSARDWQIKWGGTQWCRGKSFDTFCPLGPCIVTRDDIPDPSGLRIRTTVNGEILQDGDTGDMIFDVPALVAFLSGSTTLLPGTVILTGTPHGVGMAREPKRWLQPGDTVIVEIEKIGSLVNPVGVEPS
jgi:2-keto-4-pentenoate hydratase/2-oxohepta-3-ene-1,7-dioic acid hydratase in catechol pathway